MVARAALEDEALVAIGALDEILVAHFQEDPGVAQGAATAVAGDAAGGDFDGFGHFDWHFRAQEWDRWPGSYKLRFAGQGGISMVKLDKIYTRGGDLGQSGLTDGSRRSKADVRFAAIGAVDETNSVLGVARLHAGADDDAMLARIQNDLFDLGADLSAPQESRKARSSGNQGALRIVAAQVERLEREIDAINAHLAPLTSFVLPGGSALAAQLHVARATARRAEREMVALAAREDVNPCALSYINRLSDHLFVLARAANGVGAGDVLWIPGKGR